MGMCIWVYGYVCITLVYTGWERWEDLDRRSNVKHHGTAPAEVRFGRHRPPLQCPPHRCSLPYHYTVDLSRRPTRLPSTANPPLSTPLLVPPPHLPTLETLPAVIHFPVYLKCQAA